MKTLRKVVKTLPDPSCTSCVVAGIPRGCCGEMNVRTRSLLHRVVFGNNGIFQQLIPESASIILTVDFSSSSLFHSDRTPPSSKEKKNLRHQYQKHREDFLLSKERIKLNLRTQRDETVRKVKEMATKENIFTIPNLLCVVRIGLTPYIGYLILHQDFRLACGVAFFAGLTDLADGYIARKFPSQRSNAGSFLDPLADKLLVTTVVITLTMVHLIPGKLSYSASYR
ncbi:hypothetical protein RvY_11482-2 [Ramazzottius varieornatus]|uniref:cardiolipin synthase (CMP-forming) n=1 Tax=Ramazzottius varieornatus TaxID=947166 RepID=A0A1D1VP08_RAMVA|nr:hypothetical protein RvY_11482-2 [Ramazzottius varieornatus]